MKLYSHPFLVASPDDSGLASLIDALNNPKTHYTLEMCLAFHKLLVVTLHRYGQNLAQCASARTAGNADDLETQVKKLHSKVNLLWCIGYSSFLVFHLQVLCVGLSVPPSNGLTKFITDYLGFMPTSDLEGTVTAEGPPTGENGTPNDVDSEVDEEAKFLLGGLENSDSSTLVLMFRRWIRLQTSHFQAINVLSPQRGHKYNGKVEITLLNVRMPPKNPTIQPWRNILEEHAPPSFDIGNVLQTLTQRATAFYSAKNTEGTLQPHSIIKAFSSVLGYAEKEIDDPTLVFSGNVHCEAALASLTKYVQHIPNVSDELSDLVKVQYFVHQNSTHHVDAMLQSLDQRNIAVSKLCCPVCWELLQLIGGDTDSFKVRGFHTTLYTVELPSWLPRDVVEKMVDLYGAHLRHELNRMMELPFNLSHNRTPSGQSDWSVQSGESLPDAPKGSSTSDDLV
jgi:hypothetical protein